MNVIAEDNKGLAGQMVLQGLHIWAMWVSQQLMEHFVDFEVSL